MEPGSKRSWSGVGNRQCSSSCKFASGSSSCTDTSSHHRPSPERKGSKDGLSRVFECGQARVLFRVSSSQIKRDDWNRHSPR